MIISWDNHFCQVSWGLDKNVDFLLLANSWTCLFYLLIYIAFKGTSLNCTKFVFNIYNKETKIFNLLDALKHRQTADVLY